MLIDIIYYNSICDMQLFIFKSKSE